MQHQNVKDINIHDVLD